MKLNLTIWEMVPEESIQYQFSHRKCEKATTELALTGSHQMVAETLRALADSIHDPRVRLALAGDA